jgi:hypothetical protein
VLVRLVAAAARRPGRVVAAALALTVVAGLLALRLDVTTGTDSLVGGGTATRQATDRHHERFGDDAVYVLVREDLTDLMLSTDLGRLLGLEGCISGNAPAGAVPPGGPDGPCAELARTKPVQAVFGPATFVNESVRQLGDELERLNTESAAKAERAARAARGLAREQGRPAAEVRAAGRDAERLVRAEFTKTILELALKYDLRGAPRLDDPQFVSQLVFDAARPPLGTPKRRFAYLFPDRRAALVQVRLDPGLADAERTRAIALVRRAVAMPEFRLERGGSYVVTGAPVVVSDLTDSVTSSIVVLLVAALLVMAATLAVVFRVPLRLLPLAVAVAAAALTFGALSLAGASLTMASIAVLPVLIGLAVDYAIQLQARTREEGSPEAMARRGAPTVVTAAAATAAGFLVLVLSPVPMVRGFGVLLVVGIAIALLLALTLGTAALVLGSERALRVPDNTLTASVRGAGELLAPAARRVRGVASRAGARVPAARLTAGTLALAPAAPAAGPRRRRRARARRVGARHPDPGRVRRDPARPAGRVGPRPARPAGVDRGGRAGRRPRRGRRPERPGRDRLDEHVPAGDAEGGGLRPGHGLRAGRPVPRLLAARPVPAAAAQPRGRPRPARDRAAVLLAQRHRPRPAHRDARVRDPLCRPGGAEGDHGSHARAARAAARCARRARRAARPRRGGERADLLRPAAAADARARARGGVHRPVRRAARGPARGGAARADRAGDRAGRRSCSSRCASRSTRCRRRSAPWSSRSRPSSASC